MGYNFKYMSNSAKLHQCHVKFFEDSSTSSLDVMMDVPTTLIEKNIKVKMLAC